MKDHIAPILKAIDRLITERDSLLEENAKFIAERDQLEKWHTAVVDECIRAGFPFDESNPFMLVERLIDFWAKRALKAERDDVRKTYVDAAETFNSLIGNYLSKIEELRAEREAMMKQEPSALVTFTYVDEDTGQTVYHVSVTKPLNKGDLLYAQPIKAQQRPEGYEDKRKDSLLEYLKLQRRKLNSHYETRLKIVPSMDKEPWLSNIKKWDDWIDFVLSASQPKGM